MKRILPFFIFLPVALFAQISIDVSDMTQIGDVIVRKADTLTPLSGPGNEGANQTWNFTQVSAYVNNETTTVVAPSSTPSGSAFPSANLAMTNDNANYLYFDQNSTHLNTLGLAGDFLGTGSPVVAPLTSGLLVHNFPRTYGSNFSDTYSTDVTFDGSSISPLVSQIRFKRVGLIMDTTDAWGQLTTPASTYNTLRVKRVEYTTDSIWIKPSFPPTWSLYQTSQDTTLNFQWFANNEKLAVAEMTFDSLGTPKIFRWMDVATNGIKELTVANFQLYPNPVGNQLNISFDNELIGNDIHLEIIDETGRIIDNKSFVLNAKEVKVETNFLQSGCYFLKVNHAAGTSIKRFVKN